VIHTPSGRRLTYGALAREAADIHPAQEPAIKPPSEFRLCGNSVVRLDSAAKSTGKAQFGIDVRLPGMLYAAVVLCPVPGGNVKSFDPAKIAQRRGVQTVVPVPGGVAVVADRYWRGKQAAAALPIKWDFGPGAGTSTQQFRAEYRAALDGPMVVARSDGDARAAFSGAKAGSL
jgi:isoquinoline 1-oxidoreductase subunit beta